MPRWDGSSDPAPNERRIDGDRITEMVQAEVWTRDETKNPLERIPYDAEMLPNMLSLPRTKYRDHLHDNQREQNLVDPAAPGLTQYVRVSRRIDHVDREAEEKLQKMRVDGRAAALAIEAKEAQEANELLELKSLGIRTAMAKYKELQDQQRDGGRAHTFEGKLSKAAASSAFFMG